MDEKTDSANAGCAWLLFGLFVLALGFGFYGCYKATQPPIETVEVVSVVKRYVRVPLSWGGGKAIHFTVTVRRASGHEHTFEGDGIHGEIPDPKETWKVRMAVRRGSIEFVEKEQ